MAHATDFGPIGPDGKRRYMEWDPKITFGNVVTILMTAFAGIGAFYNLKEGQSNQQILIQALQAKDTEMTARGNERYSDLKGDIKELKQSVYELNLQIARSAMPPPVPQQQVAPRFTPNGR